MNLHPTVDRSDPDFDPVLYERALEHATDDLRRIVTSLASRYLNAGPAHALSWAVLLEIEEQAFSDLGFQSRHERAIIDAFTRLRDCHLTSPNLDEAVDWRRDDLKLATVYLILRASIDATAAREAE